MQEEKQKCYPSNIKITENEAIVNLQSLLDHTTERLFQVIGEVSSDNLIFFYKWGLDGSGNHTEFKQKFNNSTDSDSCVLITSIVPIRVVNLSNQIIWQNEKCSSSR